LTEETEQVVLCPIFTAGSPTASITWLKNGQQLSSGDDFDIQADGSLYFPCVKKEHAGRLVVLKEI